MYYHNNYSNFAMDMFGYHNGNFGQNVASHNSAANIVKFHKLISSSTGFKQLCRFCLKRASHKIDKDTLQSFKMLTNSKLVCKPEYPKSICSLCKSQLQSAYKLRVSLLDMERCWTEYFRQDYRQFIRSLSISDEHIYDEIFLEIEMADSKDSDTSSMQSFEQRPLLRSYNDHQLYKKSCIGQPRGVYALTLLETAQRDEYTSSDSDNQKRYPSYHQSSNHAITQTMDTAGGNQSFELSDHSRPVDGHMSAGGNWDTQFIERNHDTVSLSNENVDYCLPAENRLDEWNAGGYAANKIEIKCVVVGNAAVGKTNLILSYLKNKFNDQHVPTVCDIYKFDVDVNEQLVQVMLFDTAGQDHLDPLRRLSYSDCNVFLLCFSVVQPESFKAIELKWAPKFLNANASLVLVGTQNDLRSDSKTIDALKKQNLDPVSTEDAQKLARSIRAKYMETSSRNNDGVKDAFDVAVQIAMKKIETAATVDDEEEKEQTSCWKNLLCMCCVS